MANSITTRRVMDRLNDNPMMRSLKQSSVATYMKDMVSINNLAPTQSHMYKLVRCIDGRVELPENCLGVEKVFVCREEDLNPLLFEDNSLNAATSVSTVVRGSKNNLGAYAIENGVLFTDIEDEITLEIKYKCIAVDNFGYPTLPYDGSLMQALENYIKYRYYTILYENDSIARHKVDSVHREYTWYIGQYTSKVEMPTYDEAVSFAHSWQTLIDDRSRNTPGRQFRDLNNL